MMCIGWKTTDHCTAGIDACSVIAVEGGAVITDPTGSGCKPEEGTNWKALLVALGLGMLLTGNSKMGR